jgi:fido (protein-threonine AMPylation protein)
LENSSSQWKLGGLPITDQDLLDEFEADFTAIRLLELTQNLVEGSFELARLCDI